MKKGYILFIILLFPSVLYLFLSTGKNNILQLPIYGPKEPFDTIIDGKKVVDTIYHIIPPFKFTDQLGHEVTNMDYKDKIYVADFFFTTCKSICPKMSSEFRRVQEVTKDSKDVMFISHTVNPEADSVPVLLEYSKLMTADNSRWHFVTGGKKELYDMARKGYLVPAPIGNGEPSDFIHSEMFILVDKKSHIRGFYDGTNKAEVDRLIDEIKVLHAEELIPRKEKK